MNVRIHYTLYGHPRTILLLEDDLRGEATAMDHIVATHGLPNSADHDIWIHDLELING